MSVQVSCDAVAIEEVPRGYLFVQFDVDSMQSALLEAGEIGCGFAQGLGMERTGIGRRPPTTGSFSMSATHFPK